MDSFRIIVRGLRVASLTVEKVHGLSGAQLFVLQQLADGATRSVNELANRTLTHQSTVSGILGRLVERGLVLRAPSAQDTRQMDISLTARGRRILEKAPVSVPERLITAIGALSASEKRTLRELMERVLQNADLSRESAPLFFEEGEKESKNE